MERDTGYIRGNFETRIQDGQDFARGGVDIFIYRHINSKLEIVRFEQNPTITIVDENMIIPGPTFTLDHRFARNFLKAVAEYNHTAGIRAEGNKPLENELTSVRAHLADMKRLVFDTGHVSMDQLTSIAEKLKRS